MKKRVVAGFNITCVGDDRAYSFLPSRQGGTMADKVALNVLQFKHPNFLTYSFAQDRGGDERQYCSPGVDLPVVSVMRSKYDIFPEYHTSLDNLDFVSPTGLRGGFEVLCDCIHLIEENHVYRVTTLGEPQLGSRGLYPDISTKETWFSVKNILNLLAYADGKSDLVDISHHIGVPALELLPIVSKLRAAGLLEVVPS